MVKKILPEIPLNILYRLSVVRVNSSARSQKYAAKLYKARYRRDGVITYRPIKQVSESWSDYYKAREEGIKECPGIIFEKDIKLGKAVFIPPSQPR
jgi:hypothetical protein